MLSLRPHRRAAHTAIIYVWIAAASVCAAAFGGAAPACAQTAPPTEAQTPASVAPVVTLADALVKAGKFAEAVKTLADKRTALPVTATDAEKRAVAVALASAHYAWADSLRRAYDYPGAIAQYQAAYALDAVHRVDWAGAELFFLGMVHFRLNQDDKALAFFTRAVSLLRQAKDLVGEANALNSIGAVYSRQSQFDKALSFYEQALPLQRQAKDIAGEAVLLNNMGYIHRNQNRFDKALELYQQALTLHKQVKNPADEASTLINIGYVHRLLSQYDKALSFFEQALRLQKEAKDYRGEAATLNNIGAVYSALRRYDKTLDFYQQSLVLRRQTKDVEGEATMLSNMGQVFDELGQHDKALTFYQQALPLQKRAQDGEGEASTLVNIGAAYNSLSQFDKALSFYQQALTLQRRIGDGAGEANTLNNIGYVYHNQGKFDAAYSLFEQALPLQKRTKDRMGEAITLNNLMLTLSETKNARRNARLAILYGKQSVNLKQEARGNIRTFDQGTQKNYAQAESGTYRALANLLIAEGRLGEAEQVLNFLKDDEVTEYLKRASAVQATLDKLSLTPREKAFADRYRVVADKITTLGAEKDALEKKKIATPLTATETTRLDDLDEQLREANKAFLAFLGEMNKAFRAGESGGRDNRIADMKSGAESLQGILKTIQTRTGKRTAALYTLSGEDEYRVILVTPSTLTAGVNDKPLPAAELNAKIEAFRAVLRDPTLDPKPLAQELYQLLIGGPIGKDLASAQVENLLCSLDGSLRYLPLGALHDGEKYLVERFRTSLFTPAITKDLDRAGSGAPGRVLALGVTEGKTVNGKTFAPLPGAGAEIKTAAPGPNDRPLLNAAFTRKAARTALRESFPLVHIASHFSLDPASGSESFLLLGDGSAWSLADMESETRLFEGVELLLLSACDTGVGSGVEVDALGDVAQRKGAQAVVASLWPVSDPSTAALMTEFYRLRRANAKQAKGETLRQAQLALLNGTINVPGAIRRGVVGSQTVGDARAAPPFKADPAKPCAHPFYWAAFVLIGNGL